jgi:hypothetical protein
MALDLNIPAIEDEEDDPFGGSPHGQDYPPPAGDNPIGDAHGAPSLYLNKATTESC